MAKSSVCKECGSVVMRISWSQIRAHETCKQRGFLQRTGKRATLENTRIFFPGTVTDRVVRDWLVNDPLSNLGAMPDMVESVIDREWKQIIDDGGVMQWKDPKDRAQVLRDCREAARLIEPALLKWVVPFEYQADLRFQVPVEVPHPNGGSEKILLIGAMDILVHDNRDRWWVWDVKHTRDDAYWRKVKGQLTFYDLCVELMEGKPTIRSGLLQPLCKEQVKPFVITAEDRAQMLQRIAALARDRFNDEHPPRTDTKECGWCSVKHACSKFAPVVGSDGKRRVAF